jgi:hypothetical protein
LEIRVDVYDYAAIVKHPVMYQITNGEFRPGDIGYGSHSHLMRSHAGFAALMCNAWTHRPVHQCVVPSTPC